jgi:translation initiation factor IF-3
LSDHRVNERIRAREVRLIDPDGKQLGVKPLPEALAIARQMDLDLVEVAPDANPPVCRIMDYNRFKYESAQRAKESRKKATSTSIKEMKYRPKIGTGDFTTKTRQVARFLEEGHKVKVTIMFRGREVSHPELGMKILDDLAEQVSSVAKVEAAPKLDGRNMVMVLAPDRRARQATRRATDLAQATGLPPTAPEPGGAERVNVVPAGPGPADLVAPAPAPAGAPSTGAPSTGAPSTGTPDRLEAPVGSANGAAPPARQPATVAASAPAASRTPEGDLASHSS